MSEQPADATAQIRDWHVHVYFDAQSIDRARALCEAASQRFDAQMGRVHERPVGPHPRWSCQLAFGTQAFGELVPWLALHRDGLSVLVHPNTGDDVRDHTANAMWMGEILDLDLSVLE